MGIEKLGPEGAALAAGAVGGAAVAVGVPGAATVVSAAASLPTIGSTIAGGASLAIAAAPVVVPAAIFTGAAYGVYKIAKWLKS